MSNFPKLNPLYRLQFEKAQNCYVLLYPEGMVKLSDSASEVLTLVDGSTNDEDIVKALQQKFPDAAQLIETDVKEFLVEALEKGWIKYDR
ncbi:pyrroloquinoline quinone biosynthesis peptide chaperone PqqD [Glaciecola sp. MF2-115]|uniref:pyrroloquinoline quinone biosynthesis peptide chaperone PqqD n=1 Tax=Glaciecola sp. MF2-115 TaxID=3384827 RepID=UPI0039A0122B